MVKKGDTLVEVALAIGIFSMVAIATVSVMNGGTSSAQTALETTLAREEIDAQAEALRFIQASFISDKEDGDNRYEQLWDAIVKNAQDPKSSLTEFTPTSCSALYSGPDNIAGQNAFVVNTRALGTYSNTASPNVDGVIISAKNNLGSGKQFVEAPTYPHLIFGTNDNNNTDSAALAAENSYTNRYQAAGRYVVAVKENDGTNLVDTSNKAPAYYDFYIRSCWYGAGDSTPSTISTVIRLYNPNALEDSGPDDVLADNEYRVNFYSNPDQINQPALLSTLNSRLYLKAGNGNALAGYVYGNAYPNRSYTGPVLVSQNRDAVTYRTRGPSTIDNHDYIDFTSAGSLTYNDTNYYYADANWWMEGNWTSTGGIANTKYYYSVSSMVSAEANAAQQLLTRAKSNRTSQIITRDTATALTANAYNRSGYTFKGWSTTPTGDVQYSDKQTVTNLAPGKKTIDLYAIWEANSYYVDVNPVINGDQYATGTYNFTFDVYINGDLVADNVRDYYRQHPYGTVVRVVANSASGCTVSNSDTTQIVKNGAISFAPTWTGTCAYKVDVNPTIDGTIYYSGLDGFSFDVYLNGTLFADDVRDFYQQISAGTSMRVVANAKADYTISNGDITQTINGAIGFYPTWTAIPSMQTYTASQCASQASSGPVSVKDRRDGNFYNVRYINGRCWMVQNLRITGTISSTDSNFSNVSSWNVSTYDLTQGSYYSPTASHDSGNATNGVWYNFCAASAGNSGGCTNAYAYNSSSDICPANWRLPTSAELQSVTAYSSQFAPITNRYWDGVFYNTSLGVYWSSTPYDETYQDVLLNDGGTTFNIGSYNKGGGYYIRCIHR